MQVDGLPSEHAPGGLGVAQNCGQRLAQLVGQRTGELAEDRDAAQMRQELALLLRLTLGALALGDVPDRRDEARVTAHLDGLGRDDRLAQLAREREELGLDIAHGARCLDQASQGRLVVQAGGEG